MQLLERVDQRVLGAVRFLDSVTRQPISRRLEVSGLGAAEPSRILQNRRGLVVISGTPGLEGSTSFDPPPAPPPLGSIGLALCVVDPGGRYLPRRFGMDLPRSTDPAAEDNVFTPVEVGLFRTPTAAVSAGWAVVRVTVATSGGRALGGALVRMLEADTETVLARAITEWRGRTRGEALLARAGVPVTTWSESEDEDEEPISTVMAVRLEAIVDPVFDAALLASDAAPQAEMPAATLPDPDDLESRAAVLPSSTRIDFDIAAGRARAARLQVDPA